VLFRSALKKNVRWFRDKFHVWAHIYQKLRHKETQQNETAALIITDGGNSLQHITAKAE
jgi:hypothetical protein